MPCTPFSGIGFRSFVLRLGNAANPDALHAFPFGGTGSAQDRAAPQPLNRQTHQRHNDATGNLSRWFQSTVPLHPRLWSPPGSMGLAVLPALGILCLVFPDRLTRTVPVLKQRGGEELDIRDLGLSSSKSAGGSRRRGCSGTSGSTFGASLSLS
jgi:hypothetical protein